MGDGFVKIYGEKLLDSTLSLEDPPVRLVFLLMLAIADQDGVVDLPGIRVLSRKLNLPVDYVRGALDVLTAPDPDSRTKAEDGRRIVARTGEGECGWLCVNRDAYREYRGKKVEQSRVRMQRMRERNTRNSDARYAQENREQSTELREERKENPQTPTGGPVSDPPPTGFSHVAARVYGEVTGSTSLRADGMYTPKQQQALEACGGWCNRDEAKLRQEFERLHSDSWLSRQPFHVLVERLGSPVGNGKASGPATPPKDFKYDDADTTI